jgi:hypothetical protein
MLRWFRRLFGLGQSLSGTFGQLVCTLGMFHGLGGGFFGGTRFAFGGLGGFASQL